MLLVPVFVMSHTTWYNLGPWWAGRHGPATCPGSRNSQELPGLCEQGYSQRIKGKGYLFSALHLDAASVFGPPGVRRRR